MIPGIISRDGNHLIEARRIGEITATIAQRQPGVSKSDHYTVYSDIPINYFTLVDQDEHGNIYLGVNLLEESTAGPSYNLDRSHEVVVILDGSGNEKRRIYMPPSTTDEVVVHSIRVAPDGSIYQLVIGDDGAIMWRYRLY